MRRNGRIHFTGNSRTQFLYLLTRNRSKCGVRPYCRATTNPDADSWVREFIDWWIGPDGYAIPERAGVIRWMRRGDGDTIEWSDEKQDEDDLSVTFIPAKLDDNPALIEADPKYKSRLMIQDQVTRARLLDGNWNIRPAAGLYFQRQWVYPLVEAKDVPEKMRIVRGWDLASTKETEGTDPDWTCGTKMGRTPDGVIWILHHTYARQSPGGVKKMVKRIAEADTKRVEIAIPQDPGQAGKDQATTYVSDLAGFTVRTRRFSGDKVVRFGPFSAQAEAGNVRVVRAGWNDRWFAELENFPPPENSGHDDDADSTSQAYHTLVRQGPRASVGRYRVG